MSLLYFRADIIWPSWLIFIISPAFLAWRRLTAINMTVHDHRKRKKEMDFIVCACADKSVYSSFKLECEATGSVKVLR